jgi:hypothetical protein
MPITRGEGITQSPNQALPHPQRQPDALTAPATATQHFGHQLKVEGDRMAKAEGKGYADFADAGARLDIHNLETELAKNIDGANPQYKSELERRAKEIYGNYLNAAPNKYARQALNSRFQEAYTKNLIGADILEKNAKVAHIQNLLKKTQNTLYNTVDTNPGLYNSALKQGLNAIQDNDALSIAQKENFAQEFQEDLRFRQLAARARTEPGAVHAELERGRYDAELAPNEKQKLLHASRERVTNNYKETNARFEYLIAADKAPASELQAGLQQALKSNQITVVDFYKRMGQIEKKDKAVVQRRNTNAQIDEKIKLGLPLQVDNTDTELANYYRDELAHSNDYSIENKTAIVKNMNAGNPSYNAEFDFAINHGELKDAEGWLDAFDVLDNTQSAAVNDLSNQAKAVARAANFYKLEQHMPAAQALTIARSLNDPKTADERKQLDAEFEQLRAWTQDDRIDKNRNNLRATVADIIGAKKWFGWRNDPSKIPLGDITAIRRAAKDLHKLGIVNPDMLKFQLKQEFGRNYGESVMGGKQQFRKWPQENFDPDTPPAAIANSSHAAVDALIQASQGDSSYQKYSRVPGVNVIKYDNPNMLSKDLTKGELPRIKVGDNIFEVQFSEDNLTPLGIDGRPSYSAWYWNRSGLKEFVVDPTTGMPWRYVPKSFGELTSTAIKPPPGLKAPEKKQAQEQLKALRREAARQKTVPITEALDDGNQ